MSYHVFNQNELGNKGFCQSTEKMGKNDSYIESLSNIESILANNHWSKSKKSLYGLALTNSKTLKETNFLQRPSVLYFDISYQNIFDLYQVYIDCLIGRDQCKPHCDFAIVYKPNNPKLSILAYSNVAPIIILESEHYYAVGVILKPQLIYLEGIFKQILSQFTFDKRAENTSVTVATCTHYRYSNLPNPDDSKKLDWEGSIPEYIGEIAKKFPQIVSFNMGLDTEDPKNNLFNHNDWQNNAVAVW